MTESVSVNWTQFAETYGKKAFITKEKLWTASKQPTTNNRLYLYPIILYLKKSFHSLRLLIHSIHKEYGKEDEYYHHRRIKLFAHSQLCERKETTTFHLRLVTTSIHPLDLTVCLRFVFIFSILCVLHCYVPFRFLLIFSFNRWLTSLWIQLLLLRFFIHRSDGMLMSIMIADEKKHRQKNELFYIVPPQPYMLYAGWRLLPFAWWLLLRWPHVYAIISKLFQWIHKERRIYLLPILPLVSFCIIWFSPFFSFFIHSSFRSFSFLLQWTQKEKKKKKKRDDFFSKLFQTTIAIISQFQLLTQHAALVSKHQFSVLEYYRGSQCIVCYHRRRFFVHFVFGLKIEVFIDYNNSFAKIYL